MGSYHGKGASAVWGMTLNGLRDELYSLNMRLLLAMQSHNEKAQEEIRGQMAEVQEEIGHMLAGEGRPRGAGGQEDPLEPLSGRAADCGRGVENKEAKGAGSLRP